MTKSARAGLIKFHHVANPEDLARALERIQCALDRADEGATTMVSCAVCQNGAWRNDANAWMQVAILLADTFDIDSQTLSELRHSILGVTQDALFG
jgi:hypothetical protein